MYIYIYIYIYVYVSIVWLVVTETFLCFPYIKNVIIPINAYIFFRGVGIPPTSLVTEN